MLALGKYPEIDLAAAQKARDHAEMEIAQCAQNMN